MADNAENIAASVKLDAFNIARDSCAQVRGQVI